jgi:hypothetical protein
MAVKHGFFLQGKKTDYMWLEIQWSGIYVDVRQTEVDSAGYYITRNFLIYTDQGA